jgi:putative tricarboxylic transport membrane protein
MLVAFGVRPGPAVLVAIIGTIVIWYAFYKLLRVPLPWGVLQRFAF